MRARNVPRGLAVFLYVSLLAAAGPAHGQGPGAGGRPATVPPFAHPRQPIWIANACHQQWAVGSNFFGREMERTCENFHKNSFDANIDYILGVISDPVEGIAAAQPALDKQRMRYVILCGRPPFPERESVDCAQLHEQYGDAALLPEWPVYQAVIKPYVLEDTEHVQTLVDEAYIHLLSAQKVMQWKLGTLVGCTGFAKVFNYLARSIPLEVRYVATVSVDNYRNVCGCPDPGSSCEGNSPGGFFRSGHQDAAIRMPNGRWRMLNTARPDLEWTRDFNSQEVVEATSPSAFVGRHVDFGFGFSLFVTAVEDPDFLDDLGLDAPFVLERLYASGTRTDLICRFNP
jgi:hypothetical protein